MKFKAAPLMQYRSPLGGLPVVNTCPRCELQVLHRISVISLPLDVSSTSLIFSLSVGAKKAGQPQPSWNFDIEENKFPPQTMQSYLPFLLLFVYEEE